jgi:hypothetical protein
MLYYGNEYYYILRLPSYTGNTERMTDSSMLVTYLQLRQPAWSTTLSESHTENGRVQANNLTVI